MERAGEIAAAFYSCPLLADGVGTKQFGNFHLPRITEELWTAVSCKDGISTAGKTEKVLEENIITFGLHVLTF